MSTSVTGGAQPAVDPALHAWLERYLGALEAYARGFDVQHGAALTLEALDQGGRAAGVSDGLAGERRSVVIGGAGAGRSTVIAQLALQAIAALRAEPQPLATGSAPLPLLLTPAHVTQPVVAALRQRWGDDMPPLEQLAALRPLLILVDGIDSFAVEAQLVGLAALGRLADELGERARWVYTCRSDRLSLFRPWLQGVARYQLASLSAEDARATLSRRRGAAAAERLAVDGAALELARVPRWLMALDCDDLWPDGQPLARGAFYDRWVAEVITAALPADGASAQTPMVLALFEHLWPKLAHNPTREQLRGIARGIAPTEIALALVGAIFDAGLLVGDAGSERVSWRAPVIRALAASHGLADVPLERWPAPGQAGYDDDVVRFAYVRHHDRQAVLQHYIAAGAIDPAIDCLIDCELPADYEAMLTAGQPLAAALRLQFAEALSARGQHQAALEQLAHVRRTGYDEAVLHGRLGDVYSAIADWQAAGEAYAQALRRAPDDPRYRQRLGIARSRLGTLDDAVDSLAQVLEVQRRSAAEAARELASAYRRRGDTAQALDALHVAATYAPADREIQRATADVFHELGRHSEAERVLRRLHEQRQDDPGTVAALARTCITTGRHREALAILHRALAAAPDDPELHEMVGRAQMARDDAAAARQAFERAVALAPTRRSSLVALGDVAQVLGDRALAISCYQRALRGGAMDQRVARALASLLRAEQRHDEAIGVLRGALDVRADDPILFTELADVLAAAGHPDEALTTLQRASALAPDDPGVIHALGTVYRTMGRRHEAERYLVRAATLDPERAGYAHDAACAAEAIGQWHLATARHDRAIALDPADPRFARAAAVLQMRLGDHRRARSLFARALRLDRRDRETHLQIGRMHAADGRIAAAVRSLARAARGSDDATHHQEYGRVLLAGGRTTEACAAFEEAIGRGISDPATFYRYSRALEALGRVDQAYAAACHAAQHAASNAAIQLHAGRQARRLQRDDEALAWLDRAAALDPELAAVHLERARILEARDDRGSALTAARAALERDPSSLDAAIVAAQSALHLGRPDDAIALLEPIAARAPGAVDSWAILRDAYSQLGRADDALRCARRANELAPDVAEHHMRLGELLSEAGDTAQADRVLKRAVALADQRAFPERGGARPAGGLAQRLGGVAARAHTMIAQLRARQGAWPDARAHAERARTLDPHGLTSYGILAQALEAMGDPAGAAEALREAVAQRPDDPTWLHALAALLRRGGDPAQAVELFRQALTLVDDPAIRQEFASCLAEIGELAEAIEQLEAALRQRPEHHDWREILVDLYLRRGWYGEALAEAERIFSDAGEIAARIWRLRAAALAALGRYDDASADLSEAVRRDPGDAASQIALARTLSHQGQHAKAVAAARQAVQLVPDDAVHHRDLAAVLRAAGQRSDAVVALRSAIERAPNAAWWAELAGDLVAMQAYSSARRAWEQALVAEPDADDWRQQYSQLLVRTGDVAAAIEQLRIIVARRAAPAAHALLADLLVRHRAMVPAARRADADDGSADDQEPAADPLDDAIGHARRAVLLDPANVAHWGSLAAALRTRGMPAEALHALRRACELASDDPHPWLACGELQLELGDAAAAVESLARAVQLRPEDGSVHGKLGIAHRRMVPVIDDLAMLARPTADALSVLQHARASLRRAIELGAPDAAIWFELGLAEQHLGGHTAAVDAFGAALGAGYTPAAAAYRRRAISYVLAREYTAARRDVDAALAVSPTSTPVDEMLRGVIALEQRDVATAVRELTRAIDQIDRPVGVALALARAQIAAGQPREAVTLLERIGEQHSDSAPIAAALADACSAAGRPDRAITSAARAVRLDPREAAHHHRLARLYLDAGRTQEARSAMINAMTLQPDVAVWHAQLGEICSRMGMLDAARAAYARAAQLEPEQPGYAYASARLLARQGRTAEARDVLLHAVEQQGSRGEWHYELGMIQIDLGQHDEAYEQFLAAIQRAPECIEHWHGLARAQQSRGASAEAIETLERALERFGDDPATHELLGLLRDDVGDRRAARFHLECAVAQDPERGAAWARLGTICLAQGDLTAAREALDQALAVDAGSAEAHAALARLHVLRDDTTDALTHSKRAAELAPVDIEYHLNHADLLVTARRFDDACRSLESALALRPDDLSLLVRFGETALQARWYQQAREAFDHACGLDPGNPRFHYLAARAYRGLKAYSGAIEHLRRAVKLRPAYSEAIIELSTLGPLAFVAQHLRRHVADTPPAGRARADDADDLSDDEPEDPYDPIDERPVR